MQVRMRVFTTTLAFGVTDVAKQNGGETDEDDKNCTWKFQIPKTL